MANLMMKKNYDLTQITRLLLEMRENCALKKEGEAYDDPKRMEKYDAINSAIDLINNPSLLVTGDTSDGYHTFNELYHHRAVLFSVIVKAFPDRAWKSRKHHDGSMYDGMFIVGIETPNGQASYHYDINPYWDMFQCKELEYAPEWDGHTPAQAIERIGKLEPVRHGRWVYDPDGMDFNLGAWVCSECKAKNDNLGGLQRINPYHFVGSRFCPNCGAKMDKCDNATH